MSVVRRYLSLLAFGVVLPVNLAMAKQPVLSLPLLCIAHKTCFIQNHVDLDPSTSVRDWGCHKSSYDGHKGVDFRILSIAAMKKGVRVIAAAPGIIKGLRSDMQDRLIGGRGAPDIAGRECGNGLVIDHGDGWETQYCHMRKNSLMVKKGDRVARGQKLGLVGLSGKTAFPHVHLSVRHNKKIIDPFYGQQPSKATCRLKTKYGPLWQKDVARQFPYVSGQPFLWGFSARSVGKEILMARGGVRAPQSTKAQALVFYGQALNLQKGDRLRIKLTGPKGVIINSLSDPMSRHKASYLLFAGKKRTTPAWPQGIYKGSFSLLRAGKKIWKKTRKLELHGK